MTTRLLIILLMVSSVVGISKAQAADVTVGQAKYQQLCVTCHGPSGKGDGVASAALTPKPKDLTVTTKTDAELSEVISKGGAAVGLAPIMPAWGAMLSADDIANVIAYVRTLK